MLLLLPLLAALLPVAQDQCGAREPAPGLLVSADWLKRHRQDSGLVILQAERSRAPFDSAHPAGARFIAMGDFSITRGDLLTELPPLEQLDALLESLGVGERGRIILTGETLPVTRLFFTLDYAGLGGRVSVLDGGVAAWRAAGGALGSRRTPAAKRASLTLHPEPARLADADWVAAHREDPGVVLLDARSKEEFDGSVSEAGVSRPGHIPGARQLEWSVLLSDGRFRSKEELRSLLAGLGMTADKQLVTYCRVGTRATAAYFAARLLGYQVRLYDGSMNEWAAKSGLPVEKPN